MGQDVARSHIIQANGHNVKADLTASERCNSERESCWVRSVNRVELTNVSLAEAFCSQGYRTALFGKWHLGRAPFLPDAYGFHVFKPGFEGPNHGSSYMAPWIWEQGANSGGSLLHSHFKGEHIEDRMASEAVDWIRWQVEESRPFFLSYTSFSVHGPWMSKAALIEKFTQKAEAMGYPYSPVYGAMLEVLDDAVGRLVNVLSELQVQDSTITIFSSDNGGNSYTVLEDGKTVSTNSPLRGSKGTLFEGGVRVPLSFSWPRKILSGSVTGDLFSGVDFFPTLIDLIDADLSLLPQGLWKSPTGQRAPTELGDLALDGVSHKALLLGHASSSRRQAVFQYQPLYSGLSTPCSSVRRGHMKLIRYFAQGVRGVDRMELYNLTQDVGEQVNLLEGVQDAHQALQISIELNELLDEWFVQRHTIVPRASPEYWSSAGAACC